ncbi:MAG: hypothetical protein WBA99_05735 [Nodosilinea sp.]
MTTDIDLSRASVREQLGNIDQIREILFGTELRSYSDRVEQIENRLSILQQEARDRYEDVKQVMLTQIHGAFEDLDRKTKNLTLKGNDENTEIREQMDRLSKQLASHADGLSEAIDSSMNSLRRDFTLNRQKLEDDLQTLRQQVFDDLDQRLTTLNHSKTAKDELSDMLFGLGTRLKQSSAMARSAGNSMAVAEPAASDLNGSAGGVDLLQVLSGLSESHGSTN